MGEAYGFFNCNAPKEKIETELPITRRVIGTPSDLELLLVDGIDNLTCSTSLHPIAQEAADNGLRYVLRARHPTATNEVTANYLVGILNQAYQSSLYHEGEDFEGGVVYRDSDGKYIFKE